MFHPRQILATETDSGVYKLDTDLYTYYFINFKKNSVDWELYKHGVAASIGAFSNISLEDLITWWSSATDCGIFDYTDLISKAKLNNRCFKLENLGVS